jgi:hypothetical protein
VDATPEPVSAPSSDTTQPLDAAKVYVYPAKGQTAAQLDRDRYECYVWAVEQTGFDPSDPSLAPHQRVEVIPEPPAGADAVAGAVAGAAIGAAVSSPHDTVKGAVVGAVIGGALGGASDASRVEAARNAQRREDAREAERLARIEVQSNEYRRALSACLEGRGYTVK